MSTRKRSFTTLAMVAATVLCRAPIASAVEPLGDLTGPWVLFVDDWPVETQQGVTRTYHPFDKFAGNPVLTGGTAWEGNVIYVYGSVLPSEDHSSYRIWYHALPPDGGNRLLYAESTDGIHWTKPDLGIVSWNGSTHNNILIARNKNEHIPSVLHTPWESDPQRRYKLMNFNSPLGGFIGAYAADGIHFVSDPANPLVTGTGDVGNFMWDFQQSHYAGYVKLSGYVGGMRRRSVGLTTTTNFSSWPQASLILTPDEIDDRWAIGNQKTDFYGLCAFNYESMYLGFLWVLRVESYIDVCQDGPIFVELVTSHDGVHWTREQGDRPPILPLGPTAWDSGMVFTTQHPLVENGQIKLYYGGINDSHCASNWTGGVGLATLRKDGFASLDAGEGGGSVTTRKLLGAAGCLRVNYTTLTGGSVRVELLDEAGNVVPGYTAADCAPLQGDSLDAPISWSGKSSLPSLSGPMRLRFVLQNASVYSFRADNPIQVVQPPIIDDQPQSRLAVWGDTVHFAVAASGTGTLHYQWQLGGGDLLDSDHVHGAQTAELTVGPAGSMDAGAYRCRVADDYGSTVSDAASLRVGEYVFAQTMPGSASASSVQGMSADGSVVCGTADGQAFIWTAVNDARGLGLPADATSTTAAGVCVKSDGTIVVAIDSNASAFRAKRWEGSATGDGTFINLRRVGDTREWIPRAMSTNGSEVWVVGSTTGGGDGGGRDATSYSVSTDTIYMPWLPTSGHDHSDLHAASDNGYFAGQYQYGGSAPTGGARNAFLFTPQRASIAMNTLSGVPSTSREAVARVISRDGRVQGGWSNKFGLGALSRPVVWANYESLIEVPLLVNDDSGEVRALNGDGSIAAGFSYSSSAAGSRHAFVWDVLNGTRSAADIVAARGFDLTDWTFTDVVNLSQDGTMMCGNGVHQGIVCGWVLSFTESPMMRPRIMEQPQAQSARPMQAVTFAVAAVGPAPLSYQWQFEGVDIGDGASFAGTGTPELTVLGASPAQAGVYRCRVSNAGGQVFSSSAGLQLLTVAADFDLDGDVDQADFGLIQACISGSTIMQDLAECLPARLDGDDDVDAADIATFARCFGGPGVLADLDCASQ